MNKQGNILLQFVAIVALLTNLYSCTSNTKYAGNDMINYPDINLLLDQTLRPFEKEPNSFRKVIRTQTTNDTTYHKANEIKWKEVEYPFLQSSFFDKKYDKQYKIDILEDTLSTTLTVMYTSLNPKNPTQKMTIRTGQPDNKVLSIYIEYNDIGFLTSQNYKLLYLPQRTIQIQDISKKPFSEMTTKITTYTFLN